VLRLAIAALVAVVTTLVVGANTRIGPVLWTVRPGNGLHDADLAAGLAAGTVVYALLWRASR